VTDRGARAEDAAERADAGAAGVRAGGGDQGATFAGETTGPGGDTSPAVTDGSVDEEAQQVVTDVYSPDGERQDDGNVTRQPTAENTAVVDDPSLSPELADAAAAEVNAAETTDAATAGTHAPGGDAEPDPK
jgi:large subunit ribosomal protein L17